MDLILNAIALIMCKKIPTEVGVMKIDQLHTKVKLIAPVNQPQAKPQAAVLRLTVATKTLSAVELEEAAE